jgi:hypothetical protein
MSNQSDLRSRAEKARDTADMMVSAHSLLRERYSFWAMLIDVLVIVLSGWLSALSLAPDDFLKIINPIEMKSQYVVGVMGVFTFCLSLIQLQLNLKGQGEAHDNAAKELSEVKDDIATSLISPQSDERELDTLLRSYSDACKVIAKIPESKFLMAKAHHKRKVEISKYLDSHPYAYVPLLRFKLWIRDNVRSI